MFIIVAILDQIIANTQQTWCYRYYNDDIDGEASIQVPKYQIRTKEGESQPVIHCQQPPHKTRTRYTLDNNRRTERVRGQTGNAGIMGRNCDTLGIPS